MERSGAPCQSACWPEVVHLYRAMRVAQPFGTLPLYITNDEADAEAKELQASRRVESLEDQMAGEILEILNTPPHSEFDDLEEGEEPPLRDMVCALEVWVDLLGNDRRQYDPQKAQLVGRAMNRLPGWVKGPSVRMGIYGKQRVYRRVT